MILPRFALALLLLPTVQPALAQQPLNGPTNQDSDVTTPLLDPPQITPVELQTLTGGPTLVTFSGTDVTIDAAVKVLLDAAHLQGGFPNQFAQKTMSVDWQQTPFWSAAAQVEAGSGGAWTRRFGNVLALTSNKIVDDLGLDGAIAARTPFVILVANSLTRVSARVAFLNKKIAPTHPDSVQMKLTAYFDPKVQVQSVAIRALRFQKQGEVNTDAVIMQGFEEVYRGRFDSNSILFEQGFEMPTNAAPGTIFSSISGVLHSEIVAATQTFAVPDVLATPTAEITASGTRYVLESAAVDGDQLKVKVSFSWSPSNRRFRPGYAFSMVRVRDGQGRILLPGNSIYSGNSRSGTYTFQLKNGAEMLPGPYSLDWPLVTTSKSLDVPFELRDVTVP